MNAIRRSSKLQLMVVLKAAILLSACSKNIQWKEEVPLNTNEIIWIERGMYWKPGGGFGNPFNISLVPTGDQTTKFIYKGKEYIYAGRAVIRWIAVSPAGKPVLVARAADYGWYAQNNYYCVVPYYVQLVPDETGTLWTWPDKIEPWLYDLPANVMANFPLPTERIQARYTFKEKYERDAIFRAQSPTGVKIDPLYKEDGCIHKANVEPKQS